MNENNNTQESGLQIADQSGKTLKTVIGQNSEAIADILFNQITRINTDDKYDLGRAKEVRENVRALIDLGKAQIEMVKVAAQANKSK